MINKNGFKNSFLKLTANIILNSKKLKAFFSKIRQKDALSYHCYST